MKKDSDLFNNWIIKSRKHKRNLLPWWIKIFTWIFLIFATMTPFVVFLDILGYKTTISIYGMETNNALSTFGYSLLVIFLLKGVVAYGLWTGKSWAIKLGIADAIIGILICSYVTFIGLNNNKSNAFNFRLELLPLIPYLVTLIKIQRLWNYPITIENAATP